MAARPEHCKTRNFASRIFLGQPILLLAVEKTFGACLTEEIARLGFAPVPATPKPLAYRTSTERRLVRRRVLSAKLQRILVCLR
jgi:hypothetical protein